VSGDDAKPCYACGMPGHLARNCTAIVEAPRGSNIRVKDTCYTCGEKGHGARECRLSAERIRQHHLHNVNRKPRRHVPAGPPLPLREAPEWQLCWESLALAAGHVNADAVCVPRLFEEKDEQNPVLSKDQLLFEPGFAIASPKDFPRLLVAGATVAQATALAEDLLGAHEEGTGARVSAIFPLRLPLPVGGASVAALVGRAGGVWDEVVSPPSR
jgi:hypothetical protein